ncbi:NAD-dependent epimerase/dehydratase family protein [Actinomadura gamaensis]|uniref:NAD-dependent epimerase/dehydratase family protein n=1 Tax=Actinomadura gamaensis TaxID=1763541 RepID=A0ABV9TS07_9ACTN
MRILVLGGTWFLGKAVVAQAVADGMDVTTFSRGRTPGVPGARAVHGDRAAGEDLIRLAEQGPWDLVIDTSAEVPIDVQVGARILAGSAARYTLVSTVNVYAGWPTEPLDESSPLREGAADADGSWREGEWYGARYARLKVGCEQAVVGEFGARATILRPGVILGPGDYIGRLPWWLRRMAAGGRVLAPGDPDQPIQPVDVRDVAAFALRTGDMAGPINLTAPFGHATYGQMLRACAAVTGSVAELEWVDNAFLLERDVEQWTELPLWRTFPGTWRVTSAAWQQGLRCRPIEETVAATWKWMQQGGVPVENYRSFDIGLDAAKEQRLLGEWDGYRRAS